MSEYTRNGSHGVTRAERDWVSRLVCVFTVDNKLYFIHIVTAECADPVRVGEVCNSTPLGQIQVRVGAREYAYNVKFKKQSDPS